MASDELESEYLGLHLRPKVRTYFFRTALLNFYYRISKEDRKTKPGERAYLILDAERDAEDPIEDQSLETHELMTLPQLDISAITEITITKSLNKTL
jgi:hypothetical protein